MINTVQMKKLEVRKDTEESYLSYIFLRKIGKQHKKLKVDLQNGFTIVDDQYPKNRQGTAMLLDKYTKSSVRQQTTSVGTQFAQRGGASNKQLPPYDKNIYWGDIQCFIYLQKGHPASHCTKTVTNTKSEKKSDENKSKSHKSSKSTKAIKAASITKLRNYHIQIDRTRT